MTDTSKRVWVAKSRKTQSTMWWPDDAGGVGKEYHRADLSADLVRAGYLAGVMDVQKIASDAEVFDVSDEAEYLSADPEKIAAIVAQVMEKENE